MKKRLLAVLISGILLLSGCRPEIEQADIDSNIYASFYPVYLLSSLVVDDIDGINLKCLVQPQDDCLRLYDLSDWDASVLAYDANAVVIAGNGLESFENALYTFGSNDPAIITSAYSNDLYSFESASSGGEENHFSGINPHVYMSVSGAAEMVETIYEAMSELYPDAKDVLDSNIVQARNSFTELEEQLIAITETLSDSQVIVMNEALVYTALDLNLDVEYIYPRESGTTLYGSYLEDALNELSGCSADVILIEKQAPAELISALEAAGYKPVLLDTMSSFSYKTGENYFDIQSANVAAVAAAFE